MESLTTGDFVVGQVLGEGRFATVFHARLKRPRGHSGISSSGSTGQEDDNNDPSKEHPSVAIKVIDKATISKNEGILRTVLQEQRLLRRLTENRATITCASTNCDGNEPSLLDNNSEAQECDRASNSFVVPLLASFHDDQCVYLVMECARGTVGDVIRQRANILGACDSPAANDPPPLCGQWLQTVAGLTFQLVQALEYIHTNSVIHCDIKPDNLLVSASGRVQLCDFGSAIDVHAEPDTDPGSWRAIVPRGTSEFSSPELLRGDGGVSFEADLWSLGCVVFALLHEGLSPFHAPSDSLAVEKVMQFDVNVSESIPSTVPNEWRELLTCLLQREPSRRWLLPPQSDRSEESKGDAAVGVQSKPLKERYGWLKLYPPWRDADVSRPRFELPLPTSRWSSERFEEMVDGNIGWSAFT